MLRQVLGADVNRLVNQLVAVCERHRRHRDFTRRELHQALREVIACLPVYRTYVLPGDEASDADVAAVTEAVDEAHRAACPTSTRSCSASCRTCSCCGCPGGSKPSSPCASSS